MNVKWFIEFRNLAFTRNHKKGIYEIGLGDIKITCDLAVIAPVLNEPDVAAQLGLIKAKRFLNGSYYGYASFESDESFDDMKLHAAQYRNQLNRLVIFLWFIRDCNASTVNFIAYCKEKNETFGMTDISVYSRADLSKEVTQFTHTDLEGAEAISLKFIEITHTPAKEERIKTSDLDELFEKAEKATPYNERSRLERAMQFLHQARSSIMLPMKVAMYVSLFECLFSNDANEISHKVAERVANYVGGSRDQRIGNFKIFKQAYDIRSALLHGNSLKTHGTVPEKNLNLFETQRSVSVAIDNLTRIVFTKVIMADSAKFLAKDMQEFYDSLVFL